MVRALLLALAIVFAIQSLRTNRLLTSALWLAGLSAIVSILFYQLGARQVAVIELSVGAGLVTVLFVFAISVAGDETPSARPLILSLVAVGLPVAAIVLLGVLALSLSPIAPATAEPGFTAALWGQRGLDLIVQVVLIFAGVLGLVGLLSEARAPLDRSIADEVIAQRDRDLQAIQQRVENSQKERTLS